jgi:hypothetical protein
MAEIDLIPTDYRNRVVIFGWGRRLILSFTVFALLCAALYVVLEVANRKLGDDVAVLQSSQQAVAQGRDALREITEKRDDYRRQWELLSHLRNSTAASRMFVIVDRAITPGDIWFLDWEFKRTGTVAGSPSDSSGTGYFIALSDNRGQQDGEGWEINTGMTIKGQASDHSALSRFVRRLYEQPEVDDVRILNTSRVTTAGVVNFDMVVTVNSEQVAS